MAKETNLNIRIEKEIKQEIKNLAETLNMSQSDLISKMLDVYKENNKNEVSIYAIDITEKISKAIEIIEALSDYNGIEKEEENFLKILYYVYELLIRSDLMLNNPLNTIKTPEELKDDFGKNSEIMYKYGFSFQPLIEDVLKKIKKF